MPRSHGYRRKTRSLLRKKATQALSYLLTPFQTGQEVVVDIYPGQAKGMPHRRYQGRVGRVVQVFKRALLIEVPVGGKKKRIYARFEHVRPKSRG